MDFYFLFMSKGSTESAIYKIEWGFPMDSNKIVIYTMVIGKQKN